MQGSEFLDPLRGMLVLGAAVVLCSPAASAKPAGPQRYVVHLDAHEAVGHAGAEQATDVVLELAERLATLRTLESKVSGRAALTEWQVLVTAGQGDDVVVRRIAAGDASPSRTDLVESLARRVTDARGVGTPSLWPLQREVLKLPASKGLPHQLLRLVSLQQVGAGVSNRNRTAQFRNRGVRSWAAPVDGGGTHPVMDEEGFEGTSLRGAPAALVGDLADALREQFEELPGRWEGCADVPAGSSHVEVLYLGAHVAAPPKELLLATGARIESAEWDLDAGKLKLQLLEVKRELAGIRLRLGADGAIHCRWLNSVPLAWAVERDATRFEGTRIFRGEALRIGVEAGGEMKTEGIDLRVIEGDGVDLSSAMVVCSLQQAISDGCEWHPTAAGAHRLALSRRGADASDLLGHRVLEVDPPVPVRIDVMLRPSPCPAASDALEFEDQVFWTSAPAELCADYALVWQQSQPPVTQAVRRRIHGALRALLVKGEHVVRRDPLPHDALVGQLRFPILAHGDSGSDDQTLLGAGPIGLRLALATRTATFRDAAADLTYGVVLAGEVEIAPFRLDDGRPWFWGTLVALACLLALLGLWYAWRVHFLRVEFHVRGWADAAAAVVTVRAGVRAEEVAEGLRPVLGIRSISGKRIRGGYRLSVRPNLTTTSDRTPNLITLKRPLHPVDWGPFEVRVARIERLG